MICPSCKKSGPVSFRCRSCGAEMMRGRYRNEPEGGSDARPALRAAAPAIASAAAGGGAVAVNPYASPRGLASLPSRREHSSTDVLASRGARLAAALIDGVAVLAVMIPLFGALSFLGPESGGSGGAAIVMAGSLLALVAFAVYQISMLVRQGQTLGKKVMNIRIVNYDDGELPGWQKLLGMRYMVNGALGNIPLYSLIDVLLIFGEERRCIHDYLAGTKVVET